jgi:hypothetical protein
MVFSFENRDEVGMRAVRSAGARGLEGLAQHGQRADVVGQHQHQPRVEGVALSVERPWCASMSAS